MTWRSMLTSSSLLLTSRIIMERAARLRYTTLLCATRCTSTTATTETETRASGWSYEQVDVSTGRTPLDVLYEERLQRIRAIFESPLPPLPRDGNVNPDFFVGFAHYEYRLRDQYRAVLARALGIPVVALQLSVAWSGRFDVTRFNRVRKVCGVRVIMEGLRHPEEIQGKFQSLVRVINERQSEALLSSHIVQASEAIPEVEFAAAERDAVVAERVYNWIRKNVLSPHLVVVMYGPNSTEIHQKARQNEDADKQRAFIEDKWLKAFSYRRVVPHILSLTRLTELLKEAVQRGEVENIGLLAHGHQHKGNTGDKEETKNKGNEKGEEVRRTPTAGALPAHKAGDLIRLLSLDDEAAWHRLLRRAVFRRHNDRGAFPLLFIHGECAGGVEEMQYLLHNREALDAVLLHPNDVAFKKKFMSRFRSSHSRLRMAEEMSV